METITLYRPVNDAELDLIKASGNRSFPPRLGDQPFFYPVMNEEYATEITRKWNVPAFGVGHVTRFEVNKAFLDKYQVQNVGGHIHNELWIPAEELPAFNANIVGNIEVISSYRK